MYILNKYDDLKNFMGGRNYCNMVLLHTLYTDSTYQRLLNYLKLFLSEEKNQYRFPF